MSEILIPKESEYILTAIYNEFLKTSKLTNHPLVNLTPRVAILG